MNADKPHRDTGHRSPHVAPHGPGRRPAEAEPGVRPAGVHASRGGPQTSGAGADAFQPGARGTGADMSGSQEAPAGSGVGHVQAPGAHPAGPQASGAGSHVPWTGVQWAGGHVDRPWAGLDGAQGRAAGVRPAAGPPGVVSGESGPWGPPQAPPGWTLRRRLVTFGAAVLIAAGAGGAGAAAAVALLGDGGAAGRSAASSSAVGAAPRSVAEVAAAVQPSVVSIRAVSRSAESEGSGVVLRADGTIITNAHVVFGAARIQVKFSDGRTATAEVVGADAEHDIAVIRAQGVSGLQPARIGDSGELAVGDTVLAVGSPLGLDGSVTAGIVSALGRTLQSGSQPGPGGPPPGFGRRARQEQTTTIENAIQTDAAINPGNSGGALVDAAGRVVGINTAIATTDQDGGNIGVGFAIPINAAMESANRIIAAS